MARSLWSLGKLSTALATGAMLLGWMAAPWGTHGQAADQKTPAILAKAGASNSDGSLGGILPKVPVVLRSAVDVEKFSAPSRDKANNLEAVLGIQKIDWSRQMVVAVSTSPPPSDPPSREGHPPVLFTGTHMKNGVLVVEWKLEGLSWCSCKNSVGVALVERFDGPVEFQGPNGRTTPAAFNNFSSPSKESTPRSRCRGLDRTEVISSTEREPTTRLEIYTRNCKDPK